MDEPKLSNFKIGRPILQNGENSRTKTAIKSSKNKGTHSNHIVSVHWMKCVI